MRVSPVVIGAGFLLTAVSGWIVRGIQIEPEHPPVPQTVVRAAAPAQTSLVPVEHVIHPPAHATARSNRNLFGYDVPPVRHIEPAVIRETPLPPPVFTAPTPVARVEAPKRPPFPYRYIGHFGPDTNPIAAFSRDGEVITVRTGDRIGPDFVVRAIGIETVEVEASAGGERHVERVALGAAG